VIRRSAGAVVAALVLVVATPGTAAAHGIGGRLDLPVPLDYFVVGAALAVVLSFLLLAVGWQEPRLQGPVVERPVRGRWGWVPAVLRGVGIAGLALVIVAGLFDANASTRNLAPVLVWVVFWLIVPFLGAVAGDLWSMLNPWRTLARRLGLGRRERPDRLDGLGMRPAAIALLVFTWIELVSPDAADPRLLALAALGYTAYLLAMTAWVGVETGLASGDAFTQYNRLISSISPIGWTAREAPGAATAVARRTTGPVWRGWLRALPGLPERPGLTTFVVVMIGTVTYDGLSNTELWDGWFGGVRREAWFGTLGLVGVVALIGGAYLAASWAAVRLAADPDRSAVGVARSFAHTLVPIALAYAFAHYFTLVIFEGQQLVSAASDPLGRGWDLFGTADWTIQFWLSPTAVWYLQVAAIVTGHVAGVVLAHDRALAVFPRAVAVRTQYAMLVLMVLLTSLGLFVLSG
jgi:hypothetical protein